MVLASCPLMTKHIMNIIMSSGECLRRTAPLKALSHDIRTILTLRAGRSYHAPLIEKVDRNEAWAAVERVKARIILLAGRDRDTRRAHGYVTPVDGRPAPCLDTRR